LRERQERILIADDDEDIVRFIEVNLRLEGFDVVTAFDGEQTLRCARSDMPDLILLDIMMPIVDGYEVCKRLRRDPSTRNISIIMLTAKSLSADKVVGLTLGADDYVIKPFDPIELIARVKSTLRRAREMRALHPLSRLPGNVEIQKEVARRIEGDEPFALLRIDIDGFKAFNDRYGAPRGDEVIKAMAGCVRDSLTESDGAGIFLGHTGSDDFVVVCHPNVVEQIAKGIVLAWDALAPGLYDDEDRERGYIEVRDRLRKTHRFPIMTVSMGISTTAHRPLSSHREAADVATELLSVAKREEGSSYAIDRRGRDEGPRSQTSDN
jgi:diguanylate cyclase (GGDEF)-like protein